uniref:Uncharacterized protein n=1 Tax=Mycena chlorophos TaxID=658473 RepID=A0ABQ0LPB6_MYCCL|nr:predicted protein [Mycena chlorophos]
MSAKVADESSVEVEKAEEALDFLQVSRGSPIPYPGHLDRVHTDFPVYNDHPQVLHLLPLELALLRFEVEIMRLEDPQDLPNGSSVFVERLRVYQDVVEVHNNSSCGDEVRENLVHHHLEYRGRVRKAEEHDEWFPQPAVGDKGSLLLVPFSDADIVIPLPNVQFG